MLLFGTTQAARAWPVYFFPSGYYAVSDSDKRAGNDYGFRFDAGYVFDHNWALEALSESSIYKLDYNAATLRSHGVALEGVYNVLPDATVQPLLIGGGGWMRTYTANTHYDSPIMRLGAGLQWEIPNSPFGLRADAVLRREFDSKAASDRSAFSDSIFSVGFTYHWGPSQESALGMPGKPVSADAAEAPGPQMQPTARGAAQTVMPTASRAQPEAQKPQASDADAPGFQGSVSKGIPTPDDSDGDGVDDAHDQCPDTPPNAVIDSDGCILYMKK